MLGCSDVQCLCEQLPKFVIAEDEVDKRRKKSSG